MDFAWSEEQNGFRAQIREFLDDAWPEEVRSADRLSRRSPEHEGAIRRFKDMVAERGWYSIGWPEEYGGTGDLTAVERFILSDEASRVGAPLSLYNVNIMGPLIIKYGSPWMKSELLPKIRDGEVDFTLGFTEPETGSDLANLSTAAYRDGDEYVINGSKMYGRPGPRRHHVPRRADRSRRAAARRHLAALRRARPRGLHRRLDAHARRRRGGRDVLRRRARPRRPPAGHREPGLGLRARGAGPRPHLGHPLRAHAAHRRQPDRLHQGDEGRRTPALRGSVGCATASRSW